MATPTGDYPRSPFDNVLNFVPQGHEKALKHAFYNAAAMAFLVVGAAAAGAVYFVLGPFLRPLLWAVLCGSVLHPFKHKLTCVVRKWLRSLQKTGTPLTVGLVALPLGIIDQAGESVGGVVLSYAKALLTVTFSLMFIALAMMLTPSWVIKLLSLSRSSLVFFINALLCIFDSKWIWTFVIAYLVVVIFYWKPNSSRLLRQMALPLWGMVLLHLVSVVGSFRIPICILLFILMCVGFFKEVNDIRAQFHEENTDVNVPSILQTALAIVTGAHESPSLSHADSTQQPENESEQTQIEKLQVPPGGANKIQSLGSQIHYQSPPARSQRSNMYLWSLVWACGMVQFYHHMWLFPLFAFPLWYFIIKHIGEYLRIWAFLGKKLKTGGLIVLNWLDERKDALFPAPMRGLFKIILSGDRKIMRTLDSALDTAVSMATIIMVIICTLFATIFLAVQIHAESMHMVQVTSNLINCTVVNNPELQALLPEGIGEMMDSMLDNAYLYGREWSANMVKRLIGEEDEAKSIHVEKQVLELWDRVYHAWMNNENLQIQSMGQSWSGLIEGLTSPGLYDFGNITAFVKENIGTFMSVLESVWSVLKGNISLAFSALTATISLLFGGGTALLNFFINLIVFMTALFYLLTSSGEQYKLVELMSKISPAGTGSPFAVAAEEAINGVFAASFKMAFFYGLWTWLIHTLFGVKMIYIPSALAAVFGAVPFLGTYWAALPAILELWLIQDNGFLAVLLLICQLLPMSFVDTAIYSEIKGGGHPYLTGLAIAGGIFCLGVEGALIGPMLLCCLFVVVNMCSSVMQESPINDPSKRVSGRYFKSYPLD